MAKDVETVETRQLLSVSAIFISGAGELDIEMDSGDSVRVSSAFGNVVVAESSDGVLFRPLTNFGNVSASAVTSLSVAGGDEANTIDLSGVMGTSFTSLTDIEVDAGNGNDNIVGSLDLPDSLFGGGGDDTILGQGGNDTLIGDDGNDSIIGSTGDDSILSGDADDSVTGDDGNDTINSGNGNDTVSAGDGNDSVFASNGQDSIDGDAGNDTLNGDGGTDSVNGGDGNDSILGGEGNDTLDGQDGDDTMNGQAGNDTVDGNRGNDSILGGNGNDAVLGGAGQDTVNGNVGNDRVFGDSGDDVVFGGSGNDTMMGMAGNDTVQGQAGNDDLCGGGNFDISGDADVLNGGDGNDNLNSVCPPLDDLDITDVTVTEGTGGFTNAVFTLTLSHPLEFTVSVEYATRDGSAIAGQDYVATSGVVYFAPGETVQTVTVPVIADTNFDAASENFFLDLTNGERTSLLRFDAEGTIIDDDLPPPPPLVDIVILMDDSTAMEGLGGNLAAQFAPMMQTLQAQFQDSIAVGVARFENFGAAVDRPFILNQPVLAVTDPQFTAAMISALARTTPGAGSAVANTGIEALFQVATGAGFDGNDMLGTGESGPAGLLTTQLAPGNTGDVPSFGSFQADPAGPVVRASNPAGGDGIGFRPGSLRLVVMATQDGFRFVDEAAATYIGVNNVAVPASVIETDGTATTVMGAATFSNTLQALLQDNIRVIGVGDNTGLVNNNVPVNPRNAAMAPRASLTGVATLTGANNFSGLTVENGITAGPSADDIQPDSPLYFVVDANDGASFANAITEGAFASLGAVNISANNAVSIELDAGTHTATFTVSIDNFSPQDVTVDYSFLDGTAINGVDFNGVSGTLTFLGSNSGTPQLQQTITVDILGDELFEPNETFTLMLSNPSLNALIAQISSTGTILDDDPAPDLGDMQLGGIGDDTLTGAEGSDTLNGGGGNDQLFGALGGDSLLGGSGADTLDGNEGDDTLNGQGGADVLIGNIGDDIFQWDTGGLGGFDTVIGTEGQDTISLNGTGGADVIAVGAASGRLTISSGGATLTLDDSIDTPSTVSHVVINGLGGNDTLTVGNLPGVRALLLVLNGDTGNDVLDATGANVGNVRLAMNGLAGNDTINGSLGNDTLSGGTGDDSICGWAGNDLLFGEAGNDSLGGSLGDDTIDGAGGNDSINGQDGNDSVTGGSGNDTLKGDNGNDTLLGVAGDDNLNGMAGDDSILGGVGKDALVGGIGNDTLDGGRDNDTISGNAGDDKIRGDHGTDYINAGDGSNTVNGGDGDDTITSGVGNDFLLGGDGNDHINSGDGDDIVVGGDGADSIQGGAGQDIILGGDGDDSINGQGGTDTIAGQQGNDTLFDPLDEIHETFVLGADIRAILNAL